MEGGGLGGEGVCPFDLIKLPMLSVLLPPKAQTASLNLYPHRE